MKSRKGFADPVTLYFLAGLAAGIVAGSLKPLNAFKKPPDTAKLTQLQAQLEQANNAQIKALAERDQAAKQERVKMDEQVRSAQIDNEGAVAALKRVESTHQTPEVKLASRFANRVSLKLALAVGALPRDQQEAVVELVEQALSDKQSEVDEANRKLALLDADFKAITAHRDALKAEIPKLAEKAAKAEETAKETQNKVTEVTNQVKEKADSLYRATQENGSLYSSVKKAVFTLVGLWLVLAVVIPCIVKHMATENPLKHVLRDISGLSLNPFLHSDAKKKLNQRKSDDT